jgi:excisionase family DNA binding protein
MDADILTKEQVADMLDCEVTTIEDKARSAQLPAVKIGRSWMFPRAALMQRLNEMALASQVQAKAKSEARRERVEAEMRRNAAAVTPPFRLAARRGHRPDVP